ncbi:hypothetical protein Z043_113724 [Scleropages formosus]|uniref:Uncharacterized protein n=1 Tax=Scleropages formosus TaxID=113540 RepID=A0A0P7UHE3_SCLFO|nr:hypothetical protein Z043_113724 [Scleropages formosus]
MNPWDLVPYTVTPAAQVLARCIASGVLSQEHLEAVPRESNVFSQQLLVSEQVIAVERENDKKNLEVDLLKLEKSFLVQMNRISGSLLAKQGQTFSKLQRKCTAAQVAGIAVFAGQKFTALQESARHLQEILREQTSLRQRLMKPLCQENLPIEANLQR